MKDIDLHKGVMAKSQKQDPGAHRKHVITRQDQDQDLSVKLRKSNLIVRRLGVS